MTCSSCCLTEENRLHTWEETENTLTVPLIYPEGCGGPGETPAFIVRPAAPHAGTAHLCNAGRSKAEARLRPHREPMSACSAIPTYLIAANPCVFRYRLVMHGHASSVSRSR